MPLTSQSKFFLNFSLNECVPPTRTHTCVRTHSFTQAHTPTHRHKHKRKTHTHTHTHTHTLTKYFIKNSNKQSSHSKRSRATKLFQKNEWKPYTM